MKPGPWVLFTLMFLAGAAMSGICAASRGGGAEIPPVFSARLALSVTPGKPFASTERVEVSLKAQAFSLTIQRINGYGKTEIDKTYPLMRDTFFKIWDFAVARGLTSFVPQALDGENGADFASFELETEWKSAQPAEGFHKSIWSFPLKNGQAVEELFSLFSPLVRSHADEVALYYFPGHN